MLIGDLAKRAEPLHSLRADLDLQHIGEPDSRKDFVPRERRFEQKEHNAFGLGQETRAQEIQPGNFGGRQQACGLAFGPLGHRIRRIAADRDTACGDAVASHETEDDGNREGDDHNAEHDAGAHLSRSLPWAPIPVHMLLRAFCIVVVICGVTADSSLSLIHF